MSELNREPHMSFPSDRDTEHGLLSSDQIGIHHLPSPRSKLPWIVSLIILVAFVSTGALYYWYSKQQGNSGIYAVYMNDKRIGNISDPNLIERLLQAKMIEAKKSYPDVEVVYNTESIAYQLEDKNTPTETNQKTLNDVSSLLHAYVTGVAVQIDGKMVGIVKNQNTADLLLAKVKKKYTSSPNSSKQEVQALSAQTLSKSTPNKSLLSVNTQVEQAKFVEKVYLEKRKIEPRQLTNEDQLYKQLIQGSTSPVKYTVQSGDTLSSIAKKYNVSIETILATNKNLKPQSKLKKGIPLSFIVRKPALNVQTVEKVTKKIKIAPEKIIRQAPDLFQNVEELVSAGRTGVKQVSYQVVKVNGQAVTTKWVREEVLEHAIPFVTKKGTKLMPTYGTKDYVWPMPNPRQTSGFGNRKIFKYEEHHKGLDIVSDSTNILAADNGVVEFAGWRGGYGNCVIINHNNGYKTLYGHMKNRSLRVKEGDVVKKGTTVLGVMGSTGNSTGPHLHFEIQENGIAKNPLLFMKLE